MGWNDSFDGDESANLPAEAWGAFPDYKSQFDPDDFWLERADREDQRTAMRAWFHARYCDPAQDTPYNGREGGYQFINGGPYDPAEVIPDRFSGCVDDELMQEVIDEMHEEVGDEWAPVHFVHPDEAEYDERFGLHLDAREEPMANLTERLQQVQKILTLTGSFDAVLLAQKLAYGAAISALEAFLWETTDYWVAHDPTVLRNIVTKIPEWREQSLLLGDIFEQYHGLKARVRGYLQTLVWHNWKRVMPLLKQGLEIAPPSVQFLEAALEKRHDIVHRSGHDKDGAPVFVTPAEIETLCQAIQQFAANVDAQLAARGKPTPDSELEPEPDF